MAWSPDGSRLATGGGGYGSVGQVQVWNTTTGHTTALSDHPGGVDVVAWSPDGTRLATGDDGGYGRVGEVGVWDLTTGYTITFSDYTGGVSGDA